MARKKMDVAKELAKIESEERAIYAEEKELGRKEDLTTAFEELGLMRWKSYYILTTGAILLLALTFVTALWVMHDQISDVQSQVDAVAVGLSAQTANVKGMLNNVTESLDDLTEQMGSDINSLTGT